MRLKKDRFDRAAERILRGVFWHERRYPLPDGYEAVNRLKQGGFEEIVRGMGGVKFPPWKKIGNVFWYTYMPFAEDPDSTAWIQLFYQSAWFIGVTAKIEAAHDAAKPSNTALDVT